MKFILHLISIVIAFFIQQTTQVPTLETNVKPLQLTPKHSHSVKTGSDKSELIKKILKSKQESNALSSDEKLTLRKPLNSENNAKLLQVKGKRKIYKYQQNKPPKQTESYGYIDENNNRYGSVNIYDYSDNCKINAGGFIYYFNENEYGERHCEEENQYVDDHPEYVIVNGIRYYRIKKLPKPPKKHSYKRPANKHCSSDHASNKYFTDCKPFQKIKKKKTHIFNNIIKNFKQHNIFV